MQSLSHPVARRIDPHKLLLSKWTAIGPRDKEKHFLVTKVIAPEAPAIRVEYVELEAVHSRRVLTLPWRALADRGRWLQGWQ